MTDTPTSQTTVYASLREARHAALYFNVCEMTCEKDRGRKYYFRPQIEVLENGDEIIRVVKTTDVYVDGRIVNEIVHVI